MEHFGEAVLRFLQEQGVDLADEDWGLHDESIPFSVQHLPLRALFTYYPDLPEALAEECLDGYPPEDEPERRLPGTSELKTDHLDVPVLLDRAFIDYTDAPSRSTKEELQRTVDLYEECKAAASRGEGDTWELLSQRVAAREEELESRPKPPRPQPQKMVDHHKMDVDMEMDAPSS